jgi:tetratricopeptide (TPR) repeat protein
VRWAWRTLLLGSLLLLGAMAWRATAYDLQFLQGTRAYRADRYREALERFVRARAISGADSAVWAWIGDSAVAVYRNPPPGGWEKDRAERLMETAWGGYAGAVLRSPLDTWSWSGLADVALIRGERQDAVLGVDLSEIDRRGRGVLDAWRGAALVSAKIAVELKPSGYRELDVVTTVYTSTAQLDAARDAVVRSARILPAPSFHTWGGGDPLVKRLYDAIMPALREGLGRAPTFERSGLHLDIGRFAMDQRELADALVEMSAAEASAANYYERYHAQRGKAQVLEAMGRIDEAIAVWDAVLRSVLAVPADRQQRGVLLYRANRKKDACRDLREVVRDNPNDGNGRTFAAVACEEAGDIETAERLLREGFIVPTDSTTLARGLIDFYLRTGRRNVADGLVQAWTRDYPEREEFRRWAQELDAAAQ